MIRNKYLTKLYKLLERMEIWEQVGPAISEEELDDFQDVLTYLRETIANCEKNVNLGLTSHTLRDFNRAWKTYDSGHKWTTAT